MKYSKQTISPNERDYSVEYEGVVKIRLGHSDHGSLIVPDKLFINFNVIGLRFLQVNIFTPSFINFSNNETVNFEMDVGKPKAEKNYPVKISFTRNELIARDNTTYAFYYKCKIKSHQNLHEESSGGAVKIEDGKYELKLYHFTSLDNLKSISDSCELWMSDWNLAGTENTKNVKHAYLTSLQSINKESDFQAIAMSSSGELLLDTTPPSETLHLKVLRSNTLCRNKKITIRVSDRLISPQPIYFHPYVYGNQAYYEVVSSAIFRCTGEPGSKLKLKKHKNAEFEVAGFKKGKKKIFEYVICGNTSTDEGIQAPYNENPIGSKMHFQEIGSKSDIFDFWKDNQNSNQVSNKNPDTVKF